LEDAQGPKRVVDNVVIFFFFPPFSPFSFCFFSSRSSIHQKFRPLACCTDTHLERARERERRERESGNTLRTTTHHIRTQNCSSLSLSLSLSLSRSSLPPSLLEFRVCGGCYCQGGEGVPACVRKFLLFRGLGTLRVGSLHFADAERRE